uniref:Prickle-like protein 4 n=2 Tax=Salvator merianae TaxID=96440 RepID=A0A8D0B4Y1_SALMN
MLRCSFQSQIQHFFLRMSQSNLTWPLRENASCSGTLTTSPPASSSDSDSGCALEEYLGPGAEIPPSELLPNFGTCSSDAIPASIQNQLRIKTLLQQLPPQDCNERYCPSIGEEEKDLLRTFAAQRRQESLGQGIMCLVPSTLRESFCKKCGKRMVRDEKVVFAPKLGEVCYWHPACFVCHTCQQPLVDQIYFHRDGEIYCGRHHAEFFRPRCASCDQLIFTSECMEAEGMRWHEEHFCCLECDLPLGARRYVMKGGQPCCCACFESLYADICQACGEIIGVDSEQATLQGQHWHAKASCFCCSLCQKSLIGQLVTTHNGLLFCSEACSLEKESELSSAGSDSSDSAFISVPSPDSTPISRMRNTSSVCPSVVEETNSDAGEAARDAEEMERLHTSQNLSLCPKIRSQDGAEAISRGRKISPQLNVSDPATESSEEGEISTTSPPETAWNPVSLREKQFLGSTLAQISQQLVGDSLFQSSISVAPPLSVLIMDSVEKSNEDSTVEQQSMVEQDNTWCPTCSSSSDSDSEPEGFFFGKPIPKPGARHTTLLSTEETFGKEMVGATRARTSSKQCSIC